MSERELLRQMLSALTTYWPMETQAALDLWRKYRDVERTLAKLPPPARLALQAAVIRDWQAAAAEQVAFEERMGELLDALIDALFAGLWAALQKRVLTL